MLVKDFEFILKQIIMKLLYIEKKIYMTYQY